MLTAQRHTIYRERICFVVKQKVDLQMIQGREGALSYPGTGVVRPIVIARSCPDEQVLPRDAEAR